MSNADPATSPLHRNRLCDEKGNRISPLQAHEILLSGALRISQTLSDWPYVPWVPFAVISQFASILNKNTRLLEFGSGRSTIWFARRCASVLSIENNQDWFQIVSTFFQKKNIRNIDYRLLSGEAYYDTSSLPDASFDVIIVDGAYRSHCLENAHAKLKSGGYLYVDNTDTDMNNPEGDMRRAERMLHELSSQWNQPIRFYTGYAPGQFYPSQGALLRKS